MMDYKQEMDYAIKNGIAKYDDIFDFEGMENEEQYKELYLFCRENLDIQHKRGDLPHSTFLYSNEYAVNARARKTENNQNAILINIGLMCHCITKYLHNETLKDFIESKEPFFAAKFDRSLCYLAYQVTTQFTYYHELGHLLQFSDIETGIELHERSEEGEFDIMRHKVEINADTYSAINIATHIHQFIEKFPTDSINQEIVSKLITILGACLLEYVFSFNNHTLYLEKYDHPHPFIRTLNIILNITNHFSRIPIFKERGIELETNSLFNNIVNFHKKLEDNKVFTSRFSNIVSRNDMEYDKILQYISELIDFREDSKYKNAMFFWDKYVRMPD